MNKIETCPKTEAITENNALSAIQMGVYISKIERAEIPEKKIEEVRGKVLYLWLTIFKSSLGGGIGRRVGLKTRNISLDAHLNADISLFWLVNR